MKSIRKVITWALGLGLLAIAVYLFFNTKHFINNANLVQGVVIENIRSSSDDSYTYRPMIEFTTQDGRRIKFVSKLGSGSPSYSVGQHVDVLYVPSAPENAKINSFMNLYFVTLILGVMSGVILASLLVGRLFKGLGKKKVARLIQQGRPIQAKFQAVEKNNMIAMNGRHPYHIIAHWQNPSTNQLHIFKSKNIWFNPTDYINRKELTVYVDKSNIKKYHMDVSFLPEVVA